MHVDNAAFHHKNANINGRDVNHITIEKITKREEEQPRLIQAIREGNSHQRTSEEWNIKKENCEDMQV